MSACVTVSIAKSLQRFAEVRNSSCRRIVQGLLLSVSVLFASGQADAGMIVYDLAADWSDASSTNGVWSYGTMTSGAFTPFPIHVTHYINIGGQAFDGDQPAWTNSANTGNQSNTPPEGLAKSLGIAASGFDFPEGRVGGHTPVDVNSYLAIQWTAAVAGTIDLTGGVWMWRDINRVNRLSLYVDGNTLFDDVNIPERDAGITSSNTYSLASAIAVDGGIASQLVGIAVNPGDKVILAARHSGSLSHQDFVGFDFTITQTTPSAIPEPATSLLCGMGLFGIAAIRLRKSRRGQASTHQA